MCLGRATFCLTQTTQRRSCSPAKRSSRGPASRVPLSTTTSPAAWCRGPRSCRRTEHGAAPRIGYFPDDTIDRVEAIQRLKRGKLEHRPHCRAPDSASSGQGPPALPARAPAPGPRTGPAPMAARRARSAAGPRPPRPQAYLVNDRFLRIVWANMPPVPRPRRRWPTAPPWRAAASSASCSAWTRPAAATPSCASTCGSPSPRRRRQPVPRPAAPRRRPPAAPVRRAPSQASRPGDAGQRPGGRRPAGARSMPCSSAKACCSRSRAAAGEDLPRRRSRAHRAGGDAGRRAGQHAAGRQRPVGQADRAGVFRAAQRGLGRARSDLPAPSRALRPAGRRGAGLLFPAAGGQQLPVERTGRRAPDARCHAPGVAPLAGAQGLGRRAVHEHRHRRRTGLDGRRGSDGGGGRSAWSAIPPITRSSFLVARMGAILVTRSLLGKLPARGAPAHEFRCAPSRRRARRRAGSLHLCTFVRHGRAAHGPARFADLAVAELLDLDSPRTHSLAHGAQADERNSPCAGSRPKT